MTRLRNILCFTYNYTIFIYHNIYSFLFYRLKVLVDLLGIDSLTSTFGLLVLFRGIASILGPPLGGLVYESSNKGKFTNEMKVSRLFSAKLHSI